MNTHMTIGLCAAVCIMVGTAAIAYRSEDFERGRLLTSHTNHFTRVTGLAPTASNLLHILVSPVNLYSNLPYTPASAVQVAYNNQIVDSLAILDITGIATQYPRLVKEHIMLCVHSNATHASVLRWCAKTLVETEQVRKGDR